VKENKMEKRKVNMAMLFMQEEEIKSVTFNFADGTSKEYELMTNNSKSKKVKDLATRLKKALKED